MLNSFYLTNKFVNRDIKSKNRKILVKYKFLSSSYCDLFINNIFIRIIKNNLLLKQISKFLLLRDDFNGVSVNTNIY
jgi:hypothetical protein